MANKIYVNNIIERTNGGIVVNSSYVGYTKPSGAASTTSSLTSCNTIQDAIDWILRNWPGSSIPVVTQYTVTFNVNGGSGSVSAITGTANQQITLPSYSGTKSGYNFGGWNTNASGSGTNYNAGASYTISGNVTLYAKWTAIPVIQYTVTYNTAGGSTIQSQTVNTNTTITLPTPTRSGYNFDGWYLNESYTGSAVGSTYTITSNITFYAKWVEQVVPVITLNPSSNQTVTAATTVSATVTNGTAANTSWSITNKGTTGNTFKLNASEGESVIVTPNNTTAPTANKGTVSMATGSTSQDTTAGTRTLTASFTAGSVNTTTYNTTVTASYTGATSKSVKLTYSKSTDPASAGTYTWSVVSGKTLPTGISLSGSTDTSITVNNTTNAQVTIAAGTIQVTNTNATAAVSNSSAFTIPAKAEQITYTVTWNGNGATTAASGGSTSVTQGSAVTLPTTNPKREYNITWDNNSGSGASGGSSKATYTFNNWWTTASGGNQVTSSTIPTDHATYYAHWTAPSSITLPTTNPTRNGYTFKGWAKSRDATSANVTTSTIPKANATYYAVWDVTQTYYWYVGYNQDAYYYPETFKDNMYTTNENSVPTEYTVSGDNGLDISETGTRPNYTIMIIPSTWSKPTIYCQLKDGEVGMTLEKQNVTITGISGVTFNVYSGTGENSDSKIYIN